jgi:hypothetical protein
LPGFIPKHFALSPAGLTWCKDLQMEFTALKLWFDNEK